MKDYRSLFRLASGAMAAFSITAFSVCNDPYTLQRERMVSEQIEGRGIRSPDVLRVMRATPRHLFVPADVRSMAYADHPLPIGYGATISQPYVVALMTELLASNRKQRVLEIGTGSGYQAAILAQLAANVYAVQIALDRRNPPRERYANSVTPMSRCARVTGTKVAGRGAFRRRHSDSGNTGSSPEGDRAVVQTRPSGGATAGKDREVVKAGLEPLAGFRSSRRAGSSSAGRDRVTRSR